MRLLTGADISIGRETNGKYTAVVSVGYASKEATADDPARALGMAVLLQAGFTENGIKKELGEKKNV